MDHHHFEMPRLRDLARRAAPQVVEATLAPLGLFYAALALLGPTGAILAALGWNYLALVRRAWRHERLPGLLLISTVALTARSLLALASGHSLFVYFLQPSLATALIGGAFLLSVPLGRPLAEKLAHDFVALPPAFVKRPRIRKLFIRISLLWALVSLANAAGTIALLLNLDYSVVASVDRVGPPAGGRGVCGRGQRRSQAIKGDPRWLAVGCCDAIGRGEGAEGPGVAGDGWVDRPGGVLRWRRGAARGARMPRRAGSPRARRRRGAR